MKAVVACAPKDFGKQPAKFRYDVLFLKAPLTAEVARESVKTTPGVDRVIGGEGVLYFSRLIAQASRSQLSKLVGQPVYKSMTIRNWNTTTKLAALVGTTTQPGALMPSETGALRRRRPKPASGRSTARSGR